MLFSIAFGARGKKREMIEIFFFDFLANPKKNLSIIISLSPFHSSVFHSRNRQCVNNLV